MIIKIKKATRMPATALLDPETKVMNIKGKNSTQKINFIYHFLK